MRGRDVLLRFGGAVMLPPPVGLGWTPPISVFRSPSGIYSTNYDAITPLLVEGDSGVTTFYVDADTGNEANPGTAASPKASLRTISSSGISKLLIKARGKFYYGITGTVFGGADRLQVEAWGGAELRITQETHPTLAPWVWTNETGGVWSSPVPNSWFGYTTVINSTDPESTAAYPQAASLAACQATAGTVFYQTGSPNKYYVHTATGSSPATGHLLIGGGGNAAEYSAPDNSRHLYRGVTFLGGDGAYAVVGYAIPNTRLDFQNCKFLHARTGSAFAHYSNAMVYLYCCTAGPSKFDAFAYGGQAGSNCYAIEIECIGRYAGDAAGPNQGSTSHTGSKTLRVNGQYYSNRDQQVADVNASTRAWLLGCTIGPEFSSGSVGYQAGNDGGDMQAWLDGCVIAGTTTEMQAFNGAHIWIANMAAPTTHTVTGTGVVSYYDGTVIPPFTPPAPSQPAIIAANANFTVADSPVTGWKRITKVGGTNGTLERAAYTATELVVNWSLLVRDVSEAAYYVAGVSKLAGSGIYGHGPNGAGSGTVLYFVNDAYAGANDARQTGVSNGLSRIVTGSGGYPTHFHGDSYLTTSVYTQFGLATSDALQPVIFDCDIANIGGYIDVKIA